MSDFWWSKFSLQCQFFLSVWSFSKVLWPRLANAYRGLRLEAFLVLFFLLHDICRWPHSEWWHLCFPPCIILMSAFHFAWWACLKLKRHVEFTCLSNAWENVVQTSYQSENISFWDLFWISTPTKQWKLTLRCFCMSTSKGNQLAGVMKVKLLPLQRVLIFYRLGLHNRGKLAPSS